LVEASIYTIILPSGNPPHTPEANVFQPRNQSEPAPFPTGDFVPPNKENTMADVSVDKNINAQIEELRNQVSKLSSELASKIDVASERADEALSSAKATVSSVTDQARSEGRNVIKAAKENPTATSSVLLTTALLGVFAGILIGRLSN
jgi:ElaB/YqjD/DUF883 family membrane-anchored ribosome-binding protein